MIQISLPSLPPRLQTLWEHRYRVPAVALAAGIMLLGATATYAVYAEDDIPNCPVKDAILAYPHYTSKGLIEEYTYRCGQPNGACRLRGYTAKGPIHDCSPFALGGKNGIL